MRVSAGDSCVIALCPTLRLTCRGERADMEKRDIPGHVEPVVSFDDWESGRVKLTDERFDPVFGDVLGYTWENDAVREHRRVIGYRGSVTETRLGTWFAEVMEPETNQDRKSVV